MTAFDLLKGANQNFDALPADPLLPVSEFYMIRK